ncbi:peptide chain release factor 1 (bRF-1) [Roseivirga pacifica]|uniref:Peptide chain release factor 1 n=1 Tax=Roseivirga pacifica TaxID=1267423 RepID=A0A1I0MVL2_9BACT|nr:peptide chain release factor 1 [Roseivirga pacifica]MCO6359245.1 peptide chain release factor 1 [Roseivirga pacifica]MCO6365119.1 peptide chain release factor 1 [Roseivirga pacifica]MCO6372151.1 peptide chain release factor 1 [Roseivirga pacifica]MCO6375738.1 peptide chain release factor 1 [Roseivirga pacifica]MCO6379529.1 peptide chain release factor 1 [Roseivirga pacifica]
MLDKLQAIKLRFEEVGQLIVQPDIASNIKEFTKLNKEFKDLEKIVVVYDEYTNVLGNIESSKEIIKNEKDEEFRDMAKAELDELVPRQAELEEQLKYMLIPKDPDDHKDVIMEIRAGAGGDEAGIFAGDLYRMYDRFIQERGWKKELISLSEASSGGFKEIVFSISGEDVYGSLKFESGVHRVQRVPVTESQGRVHTSAASVAVLPEVEDVDVNLDMKDVKKDTYRASGAGGQHVNKTESAVRLTHIPTGIVVECQDGRSQHKNYDKALQVLRSRMYEQELKKQQDEIAGARKSLVGNADRSDKIRTYNYPQGRVTDHRIGYSVHNLPTVMDGQIGDFIDNLRMAENAEKLQDGSQD